MSLKKFEALLPITGVVGLVAFWQLTAWNGWVDPVLLPSPRSTFDAFWKGMDGGRSRL